MKRSNTLCTDIGTRFSRLQANINITFSALQEETHAKYSKL